MKIVSKLLFVQFFLCAFYVVSAQSSYLDYGYSDRDNILYDSFNNRENSWKIGDDSEFKGTISDGNFALLNRKDEGTITSTIFKYIDSNKDFEIESKIRHVYSDKKTLLISLLWGSNSSEKNYFGFTADGSYRISKYEDGKYTAYKDWTELSSISKYDYNKLTIRKVGSRMYFFMNAKLVHSMYFKKFYGNRIGFQSPNKTKIRIDYIRVSYLKKNNKSYSSFSYSDKTSTFYESFSDNNRDWKTGYKDSYEARISNGAYYLKNPKSSATASSFKEKYINTDRDFEIETKIKYISGKQNSGLMLVWGRDSNNKNNFNFEFNADGKYWVGRYYEKNYKADKNWTKQENIKKYDYNKLSVRKIDNKVYYFINEKFVYSTSFKPFYGNQIGFMTPGETEIKIDYLRVSYLDKKEDNKKNTRNEGEERAPSGGK